MRALVRTLLGAALLPAAATLASAQTAQPQRAPAAPPVDSTFRGFDTRLIGPANTSGRVAAIDAVVADPNTIYAGAATGGVWKSGDGGITWTPVFDQESASSIGAVAIFQPNPDVVWVGTGEANMRNSMGVGRGVWKSVDAGRSWKHVGLPASEHISRILLHPSDPEVAYVASAGPAWSDGQERGVYRTSDGGKSWKRLLFTNASSGAADLAMDPANPNHLIAAMWDFRRTPWGFRSGGPGSGLYVSWDGGESWKPLDHKDGLPRGTLGRIGLAFARSRPGVVYALVEAEKSALLRSDDGGTTWKTVNDQANVNPRPFYYADIRVDPTNENRVYRLATFLEVSDDGGKSFRNITPWSSVHPDHHALWIEPTRGEVLYNGNDGGVYLSRNRGTTWRFAENLPLAQFYHVSYDLAQPFNVYGGLQDNGSWMGPSEVWETAGFAGPGITTAHWRTIGFGDGFAAVVDPRDPSYVYSMSQGGYINRIDLRSGEWKSIRPQRPADGTELRFNWNAGLAVDPHHPGTLYYGSQFVHRTTDRGQTWTVVSPDLTTNDPEKQKQRESGGLTKDVTAAENHTTILAIGPSPVQDGVIWVGTDDGNVQVTRDGGRSWTNTVRAVPGVPAATWVPHVEPSRHDAATAYVVFDNHRRGDWKTYVYRTTDYGRSWRSIAGPGIDGYAHVIEEDPVNPALLWVGTEFGLFFTLDGGRSWKKWTHGGFPTVPVLAIETQPREHALVVGTHGRAAWVVDDVRPLRALAAEPRIAERPLHLFPVAPAVQAPRGLRGPYYFPGNAEFGGENRPYGALIAYHVGPKAASDTAKAKLTVLDARGEVVREMDAPRTRGVNRVAWDLRQRGFRRIAPEGAEAFGGGPQGPEVLPGRYTVKVKVGADSALAPVEVLPDPRREVPMAARQRKREVLLRASRTLEEVTDAVTRLRAASKSLDFVQEMLKDTVRLSAPLDSARRAGLVQRSDSVEKRLNTLLDQLRLPPGTIGIVEDRSAASELGEVYGALESSTDEPTAGQLDELRRREERLRAVLREVEQFQAAELEAFRRELEAAGVGLFGAPRRPSGG
jgi:photosystem II stability/assembly factor-like uncharacterized protein